MGNRMMSRIMASIFRAGEIIAGGVVLGVMAYYLHQFQNTKLSDISARYTYSLCLSAASILIALMLFAPLDHTFRHFALDFLLSVGWFVAFGLLLAEFSTTDCSKEVTEFGQIATGGLCNTKRAAYGFAFLAACFWAVTFVIGLWVTMRERKLKKRVAAPGP